MIEGVKPDVHAVSTIEGTAIDTAGYSRAVVILHAGEATGTLDVTVEECATSGGTYAAITGAAFTQITTANDLDIYVGEIKLGAEHDRERYIHVQFVVASDVVEAAAEVLLLRADDLPVSQENTIEFSV